MSDVLTDRSCTIHGEYPLPRHNVVLLSCMDLRLADELASFMDRDNLTNRYDHLITAGAALGVMRHDLLKRDKYHLPVPVPDPPPAGHDCAACRPWQTTFFDHLELAIVLHKPHGVYIVEHRNCGAYREFLEKPDYPDTPAGQQEERDDHEEWAFKLKDAIGVWYKGWHEKWFEKWKKTHPGGDEKEAAKEHPKTLDVLCFLMDLRGNIDFLNPTEPSSPAVATVGKKPRRKAGRK